MVQLTGAHRAMPRPETTHMEDLHMKSGSNSRTHQAADPFESIKDDLASLRKDVVTLVAESAQGRLGQIGDTIQGVAKQTSKQAAAAHEQLRSAASKHPVTTIVIAAVAGAVGAKVLWWMLRR